MNPIEQKKFRIECIRNHIEMWQKLVDNPGMSKAAAVGPHLIRHDCWMCHYTQKVGRGRGDQNCAICPLKWNTVRTSEVLTPCECAEYGEWMRGTHNDSGRRHEAARRIVKLGEDALATEIETKVCGQ